MLSVIAALSKRKCFLFASCSSCYKGMLLYVLFIMQKAAPGVGGIHHAGVLNWDSLYII